MADSEEARDLVAQLPQLSNDELLICADLVLLEVERRLLRYAQQGPEIKAMADEGLILAVRAAARLQQSQSAAVHATGHLQVLGVGSWQPQSTAPSWDTDPRVVGEESD
jgi:hypothetical protein